MIQLPLKPLVGKLNDTSRLSLEAAAGLCLSRTNYNVELEHWLLKLIDAPNSDLTAIFRAYEIDTSRLNRDLTKSIDRMKTGNARPPGLSQGVVDLIREAWLVCSVQMHGSVVRSGHLLCALLSDDSLSRMAGDMSPELEKISAESLRKDLASITSDTDESKSHAASGAGDSGASGAGDRPRGPTKTPALDQFTIDLTDRARKGKIDPVLGRDAEVRQIIDILTRRRQNNPILTGEAGVGKTAVAEGFAQRIADGDVPPALRNVSLRSLDLGLLQAGAGIKGEFENRLKSVIEEVKSSPQPIIMFIDEAHTLIGAGGTAGQGDAANMLKPALARGELRTIAATTWAEYKKYFEKDAALARRFQVVKVEEPDEKVGIQMMRGLVKTLEGHHKVRVLDEAVIDAVRLSNRYISGRQLPDKSVSLLDTACARVAIGHNATPPVIEDCRRRIEQLNVAIDILNRETVAGANHQERLLELTEERENSEAELVALEERWKQELELVNSIRSIRERLEAGSTPAKTSVEVKSPTSSAAHAGVAAAASGAAGAKGGTATATAAPPAAAPPAAAPPAAAPADVKPLTAEEREKLRAELDQTTAQLRQLQGEKPLMQVCVDSQAVAEVVSAWTGIPVGRMVSNEIQAVLSLKKTLEQRIIGQSHALEAVAQAVRISRAKMNEPCKPIGVFLFVGTSGVGKTETAIALADLLYGGEQNMTTINMSEFKEEHKVSLLMGSPPGYVGYGEGGVLTEAVRRKPYSVVLLDEMEKAHPGVQDIFYQVFDKGQMKDGEGRDIDFKNTLIIMTSNAATDLITKLCADPDTRPEPDALQEAIYPELLKSFKPAFMGRTVIVPFFPLADHVMRKIIELKLGKVARRVRENYRAAFTYSPELVGTIAERCKEVSTGARNVDHILTKTLLPELSAEFLARMADAQPIGTVHVTVNGGGFAYQIS